MAASVTTVDVLAAYGKQLHAVVPAQIGFSRGADGIVVRSDIKRINQLKGKTIATAQFTEVDFFIRYLAQEAGLPINTLGSLDATPHPDRLNLVYTEDGFGAGDLFLERAQVGQEPARRLRDVGAQGVGSRRRQRRQGARARDQPQPAHHRRRAHRAPRVRAGAPEDRRGARARPARRQPHGPRPARPVPRRHRPVRSSGAATTRRASSPTCTCRTCPRTSRSSRGRSTRPGASTASISRPSSPTAATSSRIRRTPSRFANLAALQTHREERHLQGAEGRHRADPHRAAAGRSKPIRCSARTSGSSSRRTRRRSTWRTRRTSRTSRRSRRLVQVSPGSTLLLRGHVDNALVDEFRQQGGEALRAHAGAARRWRSARTARRRSASCSSNVRHRRQAHRDRRPRLGRTLGPQFGPESARRSAVVHD